MRIAILSDIHANAEALAPTLAEAHANGAECLILLGDYVGYHFEAARTFDLISQWPCYAVRGNHDRILLQVIDSDEGLAAYRQAYGPAMDVALRELPAEAIAWLTSLPETLDVTFGDQKLHLCHGSPFDPDAYIYWNSSNDLLERCCAVAADGVLMGHTHHPFYRPGKPWLLNPGSVGQARDVGGFSSWCLFDADLGTISLRRTAYDVAPVLARLRQEWPSSRSQQQMLLRRNPALGPAVDRA